MVNRRSDTDLGNTHSAYLYRPTRQARRVVYIALFLETTVIEKCDPRALTRLFMSYGHERLNPKRGRNYTRCPQLR